MTCYLVWSLPKAPWAGLLLGQQKQIMRKHGVPEVVAQLMQKSLNGSADWKFVASGAGITRIGIKSFVESVRLQTLNRQGLQQLQVDVHFLRPQLRR